MPVTDHDVTDAKVDVTVKDDKQRMGILHWIAVVGVGTVLIGWLVPKMWDQQVANTTFIQQEMIKSAREQGAALTAAAAAQTASADAMGEVAESLEDLSNQQEDLLGAIEPLVKQLDRVADVLQESQEREPQ